jgi:hypothetical protein
MLCLEGCIEPLDPKQKIAGPRILDIVADRPEVAPGQSSTVSAVLAGIQGVPRYRWFACVTSDFARPGMGFSNFGEATFEGCFGDASPRTPLGESPAATFRAPPNLLDNLETAAMRFGTALPPAALRTIVREIGLVVGIGVEVEVDGVKLLGFKRLVVSLNPRPNTNPPPPRVQINRVWVSTRGREDGTCAPEDGSTLRLPRGVSVDLVPEPGEERWYERYKVLTASGQLEERSETAFYSWYATNGSFARGLTQAPTRNNIWTAQSYPRAETMWIFVRDGHGGSSGCRLAFVVE